jgi:molybdopterin-synthase adenylyltransferase
MAGAVLTLTGLPLLGITIGSDTSWSARLWEHIAEKKYEFKWCHSVRVVGTQLRTDFTDFLVPKVRFRENFRRTATVWGADSHQMIARSRIGIIGLGSVGSIVAEALARMGLTQFVLIDFDEIQIHNQDRLIGSKDQDIGKLKIIVAERQIRESATAAQVHITTMPHSIAEKPGYKAALDCDVLFSCVDRPRPRHILNHFAYAHLIPVIDGGIDVRFREGIFSGADWQLQTVSPTRACLKCLEAYNYADVSTEIEGMLDDSCYLNGLPDNHRFKRNENVFPFSASLAALEVLQLVALTTGIAGIHDFGVQRYRYNPGILEADIERNCTEGCESKTLIARGDHFFHLYGKDLGAQAARQRQRL